MKVKTSITLSEDLVEELAKLEKEYKNRSDIVEQALRLFLANRSRRIREEKDLKILNRKAEALNREAEDVLNYQVKL